ncbi:MAG: hypothetical protein V1886_02010 [archaeon]
MEFEEQINSAKKRLIEKYNFEFPVIIVEGLGGSTHPEGNRIGRENPPELIELFVLHEAYHIIFNINQTEELKEKEKGNPMPYFTQEMWIWTKIKEDFPELSWKVSEAIIGEMASLGIIK